MRAPLAEVQYSVPAWVVAKAASEATPPETYSAERYTAAIMIVDVSGFTALGERLAVRGSEGAEVLWRVVNAFFARALDVIQSHGGDVLRFAGDAPIVIWPAVDQHDLPELALRVAACGLALQSQLGSYDTGEGAQIQFRAGIAVGEVVAARVGGLAERWEPIVGGEPFEAAALAAGQAEIGQVVLAHRASALLAGRVQGEPLGAGALRLSRVHGAPAPRPLAVPAFSHAALTALRRYVPRAVLDRLEAGHGRWLGELRLVTTMFVSIAGLDYRTEHIADRLHALLRTLQSAVYQYQGEINQFLVDDKGTVLVAAWGMPGSTHEGDATRAVRAALQVQRALAKLQLGCSIGISTGHVFCGVKGNERRSEYGLLGAKVNLAARLTQHAHGEILVDADTQHSTQAAIAYAAPLALRVKGHDHSVQAFRVRHARDAEQRRHGTLIARADERSTIAAALAALKAGRGGALLVEGEAGIGKSKLLGNLQEQARELGLRALMGAADRIENQTPYCAFQPIFCELAEIDAGLDAAERVYKALAWFEQQPDWKPLSPLFNPVLRLSLPDNATTAPMEGEARADSARNAFQQVLASVSPLLIVIDDLQWLDSASWRLAQTMMRASPGALFVFAARPLSDDSSSAHRELTEREELGRIVLAPLSRAQLEELISAYLGASSLAPVLAQALYERAGGVPFHAQELASALLETGAIEVVGGVALPRGGGGLSRVSLPRTLQGVIATRLDRLSPTAQLSLKTASVVGRSFRVAMVSDIYPVPGERSAVEPALAQTCKQELTVLEAPEPQLAYAFKHVITQEVAYENLLVEQRTALHRAAAEWYESGKAGSVEPYYPLIAHHWERAGEHERAIQALEVAAEQALASCANREAFALMTKAQALEAQSATSSDKRRARRHRVMGLALSRLGKTADSLEHLGEAIKLMGHPLPRTRLGLVCSLFWQIGRQLLRRSFGLPKNQTDRRGTLLDVVNTLSEATIMAWYHNDAPLMLYTVVRALNLAETVGPTPELARIKATTSSVLCAVPMHPAAAVFAREAIATAEQFEASQATMRAHQYTANTQISMGSWDQARVRADSARRAALSIGDERGLEEALNIEIYVAIYQAQYAEVERKAIRLGESGARRDDRQIVFWSKIHRAEARWCQGLNEEAAQILLAMDPSRESDLAIVGRYWALRTHVAVALGQLEQARALVEAHLSPEQRPATGHYHRVCTAVAELELSHWRAQGPSARTERAARRACAYVARFAKIFPFGLASALYYEGQRLCLAGQHERGCASLRESLALARARGERHAEKLALDALMASTEGVERERHGSQAHTLGEAIARDSIPSGAI